MAYSRGRRSYKGRSRRPYRRVMGVPRPNIVGSVDRVSAMHTALLRNPVDAPLVHPNYGGGLHGQLSRFSSTVTSNACQGGYSTGGLVITPGCLAGPGWTDARGTFYWNAAAANWGVDTTTLPGRAFLQTNAQQARCVAFCVDVTYTGQETLRSGTVSFAHGAGGWELQSSTATPTPSTFDSVTEHKIRTPQKTIRSCWLPALGDGLFAELDDTPTPSLGNIQNVNDNASIGVFFNGIPISGTTAMFDVKLTAVYEWLPKANLAITPVCNAPVSGATTAVTVAGAESAKIPHETGTGGSSDPSAGVYDFFSGGGDVLGDVAAGVGAYAGRKLSSFATRALGRVGSIAYAKMRAAYHKSR